MTAAVAVAALVALLVLGSLRSGDGDAPPLVAVANSTAGGAQVPTLAPMVPPVVEPAAAPAATTSLPPPLDASPIVAEAAIASATGVAAAVPASVVAPPVAPAPALAVAPPSSSGKATAGVSPKAPAASAAAKGDGKTAAAAQPIKPKVAKAPSPKAPAASAAVPPQPPIVARATGVKAEYWPLWDASREDNKSAIDHAEWDRLLRTYVVANHPSGTNRFRYGSVSKEDRASLNAYIERMTAIDPRTFCADEQKSYWLNLYNALTVKLVVDHYPVRTVRDIAGPGLDAGPWNSKLVKIAGEGVSLNDIEHRILRPIWQDSKIHFGLVGASVGSPSILPKAFTGKMCDDMLKQSRRDFINANRGVKLANGKLEVSEIFEWYRDDFASTDEALLKFFAFNATDDKKALYLLGFNGKIDYHYDWAINAAP